MGHQKYFRFLSIATIILTFLPIVTNRLPVGGELVRMGILGVWIVSLLVFAPRVLITKTMGAIYLYYLILCFGIPLWWSDVQFLGEPINYSVLKLEMPWVFVGLSMTQYFLMSGDYKGFKIAIITALFATTITCITSNIIFSIDPKASRAVISDITNYENMALLNQYGLISYSTISGLVVLVPVFVWYIKTTIGKSRYIMLSVLMFSVFTIYMSQQSTATILALAGGIYAFYYSQNSEKNIILILFAFILIVWGDAITSSILEFILTFIPPESDISLRFSDILSLSKGEVNLDDSYLGEARFSKIEESLNSFSTNPLIGGGTIGGHSYWIDRLGLYGLVIAIPWIMIWTSFIQLCKKNVSKDYLRYMKISILLVFLYGIMKGLGAAEFFIITFFFLPGIYFINYKSTLANEK